MRPMLLAQTTLIYGYGEIVRKLPLVSGTRSYIVPTEDAEYVGIICNSLTRKTFRTAINASAGILPYSDRRRPNSFKSLSAA